MYCNQFYPPSFMGWIYMIKPWYLHYACSQISWRVKIYSMIWLLTIARFCGETPVSALVRSEDIMTKYNHLPVPKFKGVKIYCRNIMTFTENFVGSQNMSCYNHPHQILLGVYNHDNVTIWSLPRQFFFWMKIQYHNMISPTPNFVKANYNVTHVTTPAPNFVRSEKFNVMI